jgi:uncharacterized protein (TIGR00369 family)
MPRFDGFREKVRDSFARQSFMRSINAEITALAPGKVTLAAPIDPAFGQQHGYAHAGLTLALGDSAAGYAALSLMEAAQEVVTSEMKIHLLAPAVGARLMATGSVVKAGRRLTIVRADIEAVGETDGARVAVATMLGTMVTVPTAAG